MVLLDDRRRHVEMNGAYVTLLGYLPSALRGRPVSEIVADGPLVSAAEWQALLRQPQFSGEADMVCRDGHRVRVEFAAHPEVVTGRKLVLAVALRTTRANRRAHSEGEASLPTTPLSARERDVVQLIALGLSGPEIAHELYLTHNTVRTHVRNAMMKSGARSRAHLVAKSLGRGTGVARREGADRHGLAGHRRRRPYIGPVPQSPSAPRVRHNGPCKTRDIGPDNEVLRGQRRGTGMVAVDRAGGRVANGVVGRSRQFGRCRGPGCGDGGNRFPQSGGRPSRRSCHRPPCHVCGPGHHRFDQLYAWFERPDGRGAVPRRVPDRTGRVNGDRIGLSLPGRPDLRVTGRPRGEFVCFAYPGGRIEERSARWLLGASLAVFAVFLAANVLLSHLPPVGGPFIRCAGSACPRNPVAIASLGERASHALSATLGLATAASTAGVAVLVARRAARPVPSDVGASDRSFSGRSWRPAGTGSSSPSARLTSTRGRSGPRR